MGLIFLLLFIVLPLLELSLLVRVAHVIGGGRTVALVIAIGALGVAVARHQGRRVWRVWQASLAAGRVPEESIVGGMLALLGAVLLIMPGFLSDLLGVALLVPFVRAPLSKLVSAHLQQRLRHGDVRMYTAGRPPPVQRHETEVGRARYRPGEVIDTEGEEIER